MAAPIVSIDPQFPQPRMVQRAVSMLEAGGILAYPTDSYYGIGCDIMAKKAIERLYELKARDRQKPLSIIVPELAQLSRYAIVSNFAFRVLKRLTPGPFTFVLPATRVVPEMMMSKQKHVGIRIPSATIATALAAGLGRPLVTTSATAPGPEATPLLDAKDIKDALGHGLDLILDAGGAWANEPSTIVSLVEDRIEVLRQGKGQIVGEEAS
jgi:tRNA threonylcarbamoyl adenosine modification protein (Sua5/YciO/YrdC/YwlC family)